MEFFTLADLVKVTGAKRRSLQLWADAGVIKAKKGTHRAGTGTHRLFPTEEAIVACIVHAFALHQIAIGELLNISARIRDAVRPHGKRKEAFRVDDELTDDQKKKAIFLAAIEGDASWLLLYESWRKNVGPLEEGRTESRTVSTVTAIKADKDMRTPFHLAESEGFAAVICLATYLSRLAPYTHSE